MKAVIIEDEPLAYEHLRTMLAKLRPAWNIDGPLKTNIEVSRYFERGNTPDLVISDIYLQDGVALHSLKSAPPGSRIIFATAFDRFAVDSYDFNAVHYLLKPITEKKLSEAIDRFEKSPSGSSGSESGQIVPNPPLERILVMLMDGYGVVKSNDIQFIAVKEKKTVLTTFSGKSYRLEGKLEQYEGRLSGNPNFMRVNRQYLVNLNAVLKLTSNWSGQGRLHLRNFPEEEVTVSRHKFKEVKRWLEGAKEPGVEL